MRKTTLELQSRILQLGNLVLEGVGRVFVAESLRSVPEEPALKKIKKEEATSKRRTPSLDKTGNKKKKA